jgi:hypothetical protein
MIDKMTSSAESRISARNPSPGEVIHPNDALNSIDDQEVHLVGR